MLGTVTLMAALALPAALPAIGLSASPAAIDSAQAHTTYTITVANTSPIPETVTATLAPESVTSRGCAVALDVHVRASWASIQGVPSFVLAPHSSRKVAVRIGGSVPPGRSELVAAFITSGARHGGVATSAGVGVAMRFAEPGRTVLAPCPELRKAARAHPRVGAPGAASAGAGVVSVGIGLLVGMVLLALALGVAAGVILRRRPGRGSPMR